VGVNNNPGWCGLQENVSILGKDPECTGVVGGVDGSRLVDILPATNDVIILSQEAPCGIAGIIVF